MKQQDFQEQPTNEAENVQDQELNGAAGQEPTQTENETSELEQLKAQVAELKDKYLRQAAEFDNYRRRTAKERIELMQTAGKDVIAGLLDVLDDSDRALVQMEKTDDVTQIKEGIQLVFAKLHQNLAGRGLKPMEAKGQDFDADLHEAITDIDAGDEFKGKVVDEIIKGYYLNDKIIRHAKVVVGR
jgi:molecular chaperone GrpE